MSYKLKEIKKTDINKLKKEVNERDFILINLIYETGIKLNEALNININDIILTKDGIVLKVLSISKNMTTSTRELYISSELFEMITDFITYREIKGIDSELIFIKVKGGDKGSKMTYWNVNSLFKRLKSKTDFEICPALLRSSFAYKKYLESRSLTTVQALLGHTDSRSTYELIKKYI